MKCIQCGRDNNLQDRTGHGGRCAQCNHPFAFEPTSMDRKLKFTDPFFAKAIADISANGTLYFTPKQFLFFLDRRLKRKSGFNNLPVLGCFYLFFAVWTILFFGGFASIFIGEASYTTVFVLFNLFCIYTLYRTSTSLQESRWSRRNALRGLQLLGGAIAIGGAIYGFNTGSVAVYFIAALLGGGAFWLGFFQARRVDQIPEQFKVTAGQVQGWLDRWALVNGTIPQLLPQQPPALSAATGAPSPEVTAYSFDRLVVCQSDAVAQMLIANNFHFEHNCAILSISGYPQNIFETTMEMLRRNPQLQVFALHDCCASGVAMAHRLRTSPKWFGGSDIAVIDVGLLPRQILASERSVFMQQSEGVVQGARQLDPQVRQGLTPEEIKWLEAGYFVEVESFTPQRLMRILMGAIAQGQVISMEGGDEGLVIWGDRSDTGFWYAAESFG